jgi:EAL domain-containing protein (putative c-di-GMP-specific phosphodiesterase class I)/GGDEF domain-containing protein
LSNSSSQITGLSPNEVLLEIIQQEKVTPCFQPVLDLFNGHVVGYEILARGVKPLESAGAMFEQARQMGVGWYLERVCRSNTFQRIASLPEDMRHSRFFMNVSPDVFNDPRFLQGFSPEALAEYGLDQKRIVIEITERAGELDFLSFQNRIRHYTSKGFNISLDDFGTGASSLIMLVTVAPQFLKLDRSIVRDIHKHNYKQLVLKTLVSFSSGVDTKLIAEGVETMSELDMLARLGVRYAQGYLFARPSEEPPAIPSGVLADVRTCIRKHNYAKVELNKTIVHLVAPACVLQKEGLTVRELDRMFRDDHTLDHIVVVKGRTVFGLVTREHFYLETVGTQQDFCLLDPSASVCKLNPMIVQDRISVTALARMAMSRGRADLYDPVVVTDNQDQCIGTVTMKRIISRSSELKVNQAFGANPLTQLPGNRAIQEWIHHALNEGSFSVTYGDLGRFKEYNDAYGFIRGDDMIQFTARVMTENLHLFDDEARLGHLGGDDFVIVSSNLLPIEGCEAICRQFDEERLKYFDSEDAQRGFYHARDRRGSEAQVPLVGLSLSVINSESFSEEPHPALLAEIASSLKKKIRQHYSCHGRSGFMIERRQYDPITGAHLPSTDGSSPGTPSVGR